MRRFALLLMSLLPQALLPAQPASQTPPQPSPSVTFRAETNLALVRFQVVAKKDAPIQDLGPNEIEIREDGVPQKVALFQGGRLYPRTTPLEIHLLFDRSLAMQILRGPHPQQFRVGLLDEFPYASIGVWGYSGATPVCFTLPTRDPARLSWAMESVEKMKPPGTAPLYRAIVEVARSAGKAGGDSLRAIVVVSSAVRYNDSATQDDALHAALSADVSIFPVWVYIKVRLHPAFVFQIALFMKLGELTGGHSYKIIGGSKSDVISQILKVLSDEVRYDYVAGFYPSSSGEKKLHSVQVVLKDPKRGKLVGGAREIEH